MDITHIVVIAAAAFILGAAYNTLRVTLKKERAYSARFRQLSRNLELVQRRWEQLSELNNDLVCGLMSLPLCKEDRIKVLEFVDPFIERNGAYIDEMKAEMKEMDGK